MPRLTLGMEERAEGASANGVDDAWVQVDIDGARDLMNGSKA